MEAMKKKTFQANLGHYVDSSYLLQLNTVLQITCEQKMDIIKSFNQPSTKHLLSSAMFLQL